MRFCGYALAVALLVDDVAPAQTVDVAAELQKLERQWLVAHVYYKPTKVNADLSKLLADLGHTVEIKDGKLTSLDADKAGFHLLADFDPTQKPKSVDLTIPGKKKQVLLAIYRLEDDVLSISVGAGNIRPELFMNPEEQVMLVLKGARKKSGQTPK
jgi:uncharacterized protein (TIGR03067 family)